MCWNMYVCVDGIIVDHINLWFSSNEDLDGLLKNVIHIKRVVVFISISKISHSLSLFGKQTNKLAWTPDRWIRILQIGKMQQQKNDDDKYSSARGITVIFC